MEEFAKAISNEQFKLDHEVMIKELYECKITGVKKILVGGSKDIKELKSKIRGGNEFNRKYFTQFLMPQGVIELQNSRF